MATNAITTLWRVRYEYESEDEQQSLYAHDGEQAACRFCEQRDRQDMEYPPISEVIVMDTNGEETRYEVELRTMPSYTARRK